MSLASTSSIEFSPSLAMNPILARMEELAFQMRDHLSANDVKKAVFSASLMVMDLREDLPFSSYLTLFQKAVRELNFLILTLEKIVEKMEKKENKELTDGDAFKRSSFLGEVYEYAQGIGHILPRAYLLVIIGSLLIRENPLEKKDRFTSSPSMASASTPARQTNLSPLDNHSPHKNDVEKGIWVHCVFRELLLVCRGVVQPIRGLFLRHLALSATRFALPGESVDEETSFSPSKLSTSKVALCNALPTRSGNTSSTLPTTSSIESSGSSPSPSSNTNNNNKIRIPNESHHFEANCTSALLLIEYFEDVLNLLKALPNPQSTQSCPPFSTKAILAEGNIKEEKMFTTPVVKRLVRILERVSIEDYCTKLFPRILHIVECYPNPDLQGFILFFFLNQLPPILHFHSMDAWIRVLLFSLSSSIARQGLWQRLLEVLERASFRMNSFDLLKRRGAGDGEKSAIGELVEGSSGGHEGKQGHFLDPQQPVSSLLFSSFEKPSSSLKSDGTREGRVDDSRTPTPRSASALRSQSQRTREDGVRDEVYYHPRHSLLCDSILDHMDSVLAMEKQRSPDAFSSSCPMEYSTDGNEKNGLPCFLPSQSTKEGDASGGKGLSALRQAHSLEYSKQSSEEKRKSGRRGGEEVHDAQLSTSSGRRSVLLQTLFEFGETLVQLSAREAAAVEEDEGGRVGSDGDGSGACEGGGVYACIGHFFDVLNRHHLSEGKVEQFGKDNRIGMFLWQVALNVVEVESFFALKGITRLLAAMPHVYRHRLALLLCSKVGNSGRGITEADGSHSSLERHGYLNRYLPLPLTHVEEEPLRSNKAFPGTNYPSLNVSFTNNRKSTSGSSFGADNSNHHSSIKLWGDLKKVGKTSSLPPFHSVEGLRIFLDFVLGTFLLSGKMAVGEEESSRLASVQGTIKDEKDALCKVIRSIENEDRKVLFDMVMVAVREVMSSPSYSQDAFVVDSLCAKLLEVASPSRDFFISMKQDKGEVQAIAPVTSTSVSTTDHIKIYPPPFSFIIELPNVLNKRSDGEEVKKSNTLFHSEKNTEETTGALPSQGILSSSVLPVDAERETSKGENAAFPVASPEELHTTKLVLSELYSGGDGKGWLERLAILHTPAACARYMDATIIADRFHLGDTVDALLTEALQLQQNCGGENAPAEVLMLLIQVLSTPLLSLSREQYERLIQSVSRQCSLLLRRNQQSKLLMLSAALHCLPCVSSEDMIARGKMNFDRAQKLARLVTPISRFTLLLELLEISLQCFCISAPIVTSETLIEQIHEIQELKNDLAVAKGLVISPSIRMDSKHSQKTRSKRSQEHASEGRIKDPNEERFHALLTYIKDLSTTNSKFEGIAASFSI